ncbi:MAG TPA: M20/M25/M40 family metallo-hydrolase [Gemmatimonadaceae bacterium]|nr:M20/M25/M40 family metallo-hydrolase [Gemmatimonadaceae bacterium]
MRLSVRTVLATLVLSSLPSLGAAQSAATTRPVDWAALTREGTALLQDYLRINSTNPPGNELTTARFLQAFLAREGIEARILDTAELGAGRANLYARVKGSGAKRAVALVHHMDVVPANAATWTVPAFSGELRDGFIYGRGALDMKGEGIAQIMALVALKRSGVPLTRDLVVIANADEEWGSTGAITFADRHADLLRDVEYLFTEGGSNSVSHDSLHYYGIGVSEKRTFWQKLTVQGTPSHGSRPTKANPVPRLVAALDRLAKYETPLHVTPGVNRYFRDISRQYAGEQRAWLADVAKALDTRRARDWILSDLYWNAILRNTISLTGLTGSNKTNVIPAEASAEVDIRLLPDADPDSVLATLKAVVADTSVHFSPLIVPKTPFESPTNTDFFRAVERVAHERDPGAFVTSTMLTGATDRPMYRKLGIIVYGVDPFRTEDTDEQKGVHGNDERLSVASLGFGIRFLYDVLRYVQ